MAWYYGTYSCGHEGRVNVVGKMSEREWKVKKHFEGICEECKAKERQKKTEKALEAEKELGLPPLSGTEKQVAWAAAIRMAFYTHCEQRKIAIDDILNKETSAKFWIDNREILNSSFPARYQRSSERAGLQEQIKKIDVTKPDEIRHDGIVEIVENEGKVCLKYERDDDFIAIAKELHYKWDGRSWGRELTERTGTFADRAAEAGHALLERGFCISIHDDKVKEMAVSGSFQPEQTRWILSRPDSQYLAINWKERNDGLYQEARRIKGAKWDRPSVIVNVSHWQEVEEFAEEKGFSFSTAAREKIRAYQEQFQS